MKKLRHKWLMYMSEAWRVRFKSRSVRFKNNVFFPIGVSSLRKKIGFRGIIMNLAWDILNSKMPEGHSYVVVSKLLDSRTVAQESGLCGRQTLESH